MGALGCTNTQSPGAQLKIVGGREIGLSDPVATSTLALVQPERGLQAYCSGVLVGPNKAVTAAHCIQSEEEPVYLAMGLGVVDRQDVVIRRGMGVIHPDYEVDSEMMTYNDVAVVNFTDSLPNPSYMTPVSLAESEALKVGAQVVLAGYGSIGFREATGFIPNLAAKLRRTETVISRFVGSNAGLIVYDSADGIASACGGDSGGPMFVEADNGPLQLVGITRGPVIEDPSSLRCRGRGTYTNALLFRDFIAN